MISLFVRSLYLEILLFNFGNFGSCFLLLYGYYVEHLSFWILLLEPEFLGLSYGYYALVHR